MESNDFSYAPIFELNGLDDKPISTTRKMHIRRLNDLMHLSIERGDYPRARRAWAILARCKEFDWKMKWRTGLLLLSDSPSSGQFPQESGGREEELLKKLMRHYPDEQESILQEIVLRLANEGNFREALEELDLYLTSFPFQENPVLQTYAGLMLVRLAVTSVPDEKPQWNSKLLEDAQSCFIRALEADQDNTIAKAFSEEVVDLHQYATSNESHDSKEPASDDDMEIDNGSPSNREKRIRRTTDSG